MKERPEEIQLILDNLGKQLTELRESVGVKRSYIYRNGNLPAGSVISIESAARDSRINSLFEYLKMVGGYILLKSRDENVDGIKIESIDDIKKAFDQIFYDKGVTHNWLHDKTGVEVGMIDGATTGSKGSKVGVLLFCASVSGFDFFVRKNDRFVLPKKAKKLMINKVLPEYDTVNMSRKELSDTLKSIRKTSKIKMKDICVKMDAMPTSIYSLESGKHSFTVDSLFNYLQSLQHCVVISMRDANTNRYEVHNYNELSSVLKLLRNKLGISNINLKEALSVSIPTIVALENGVKKTYIDNVIKYCNILNIDISIKKIE